MSVADTSTAESAGELLFDVTLSRPSTERVAVVMQTLTSGTATPGTDFRAVDRDVLQFSTGKTRRRFRVAILDDDIDDDGETVIVKVVSARRYRYGCDRGSVARPTAGREATGTITNDDPMPRAWLARFGRTVAGQALDAIGVRMEGGGGAHVTVGGQALALSGGAPQTEDAADALDALGGSGLGDSGGSSAATRSMTGRELLLGSSFSLSAGEAGATVWTARGRFATGGFDAEEDGVRMDGSMTSGFLGAGAHAHAGASLGRAGERDRTAVVGGGCVRSCAGG